MFNQYNALCMHSRWGGTGIQHSQSEQTQRVGGINLAAAGAATHSRVPSLNAQEGSMQQRHETRLIHNSDFVENQQYNTCKQTQHTMHVLPRSTAQAQTA
jgi:hypothetical protein